MRRGLVLALALLLCAAPAAWAQLATGNVYGIVNDEQGGALPGAGVSISGVNIGTRSTTADSAGNFRFLNLDPGTYKLAVALAGFATVNRDVIVNTGANVNLTFGMKVASMEETITVDAETPVIDTKRIGTSTTFTQDELSKVPNSRDPWALLRTVPGVVMDRVNVAGNESGQQSSFAAKGSARADAVWNLDGVNITDMAAIGASPTYFDYDAFEEIQITTSGNDIRQSTGGVGLNFVTKRGTNAFHGTLRGYFTHEDLGSANTPDELKNPPPAYIAAGARPITDDQANHNQQIADYGFDLGGPIVKDKLWFWGSYGKQDIRLVRSAGNLIDKTLLKDFNAKVNWQASGSDMVSVLWFLGSKAKFGRAPGACAGCVEPSTATWNQDNDFPDNPFHGLFKIEDNHVFSPSFFLNAKYAYYGTGFKLEPIGGLEDQAGIAARLGQTFGTTQLSRQRPPAAHGQPGRQLLRERHGRQPRDQVRRGLAQDRSPHPDAVAGRPGRRLRHLAHQPARARQPRGSRRQPDEVLERLPRRHLHQGPPDPQHRRPLGPPGRHRRGLRRARQRRVPERGPRHQLPGLRSAVHLERLLAPRRADLRPRPTHARPCCAPTSRRTSPSSTRARSATPTPAATRAGPSIRGATSTATTSRSRTRSRSPRLR